MIQLIEFLMLLGLAMIAIKIAIFVAIVAGLIYQPRVTLGVLLIGGIGVLIERHPVIGWTVLVALLLAIAINTVKESNSGQTSERLSEPDPPDPS